jgi:hypothetical protein
VIKKFGLSLALAFALVGGGIAASTAPVAATTSTAVSQAAPVVQVASLGQAAVSVQVAPLSVDQMSQVQGEGIWNRIKKWFKRTIKKVLGVIINELVQLLREWLEQIFGVAQDGGDQQATTDVQTKDYASQADYDADNAYSDQTQYNPWETSGTYYGSSCGGGGMENQQQQQMYQDAQAIC